MVDRFSDLSVLPKEIGASVATDQLRPADEQWLSSITAVETWIERHSTVLLYSFSLIFFGIACVIASRRLFWLDELYSFYLARLPSVRAIATALLNAGDQSAPLDLILRHWSQLLFGANEFGTRFPSTLGFPIASISVFWFVKRRVDSLSAFIAMFALFATSGFFYAFEAFAFEARAYSLLLGFSALALLSWQSLAMGRPRRPLWAFALLAALAISTTVHYYGILIYLPLTAGELIRIIRRRRIDWLVVAAMIAGAAAELFNFSHMMAARAFSRYLSRSADAVDLVNMYAVLFENAWYVLLMLLVVVGLLQFRPATAGRGHRPLHGFPVWERVAVLSTFLLPFACLLLARFTGSGMYPRYALITVIGGCILTTMAASAMSTTYRLSLGICLVVFAAVTMARGISKSGNDTVPDREMVLAAVQDTSLPLVCADPHKFFPWNYYLPEVRGRVSFLADPARGMKWVGQSGRDLAALAMKDFIPGPVVPYETFVRDHPRFMVLDGGLWLMSQLFADDATVTLRQLRGRVTVYEVEMKR